MARRIRQPFVNLLADCEIADRRVCKAVVRSLTSQNSTSIRNAYRDLLGLRGRESSISEAAFRELAVAPIIVENVSTELMPVALLKMGDELRGIA